MKNIREKLLNKYVEAKAPVISLENYEDDFNSTIEAFPTKDGKVLVVDSSEYHCNSDILTQRGWEEVTKHYSSFIDEKDTIEAKATYLRNLVFGD